MDERIVDRSTYATRKTTLGQEADEVWTDALGARRAHRDGLAINHAGLGLQRTRP